MTDRQHVHAHQLKNANNRIKELEAQLRAAGYTEDKQGKWDHPNSDELLEYVAATLRTADELAEPAASGASTDSEGDRGKPGSKPPSGRDRRLARKREALRVRLKDVCLGFEESVANMDEPFDPTKSNGEPRPPQWPKVRCRRRQCPSRGKYVPSVVVDDEGVVPIWWCPDCGGEYPSHPVPRHDT